jgi:hypothetical protein
MDPPGPLTRPGIIAGFPPQPVDETCGETPEAVEARWTPVEQSVGPEECRTFFREPLARGRSEGIELSHRATRWPSRKAREQGSSGIRLERRSTLRGNSRRRPGDGDDGVGEPVGSRGASPSLLSSRASWCSYHREALTLLPLRDWPCRSWGWRPGPDRLAGEDAVPGSQPACRRGVGTTESRPALPETDRPPGRSRFAGGDMGPGHRRLRPDVTRILTITGSPEVGRAPDGTTSSTSRGGPRHRPDDGAGGSGGAGRTRWASSPLRTRGPLGAHTTR